MQALIQRVVLLIASMAGVILSVILSIRYKRWLVAVPAMLLFLHEIVFQVARLTSTIITEPLCLNAWSMAIRLQGVITVAMYMWYSAKFCHE